MKFIGVILFALVAVICAAPLTPGLISNSVVGDIVSIGIDANLDVNSTVDQHIVNVITALLRKHGTIIAHGQAEKAKAPKALDFNSSPEVIE